MLTTDVLAAARPFRFDGSVQEAHSRTPAENTEMAARTTQTVMHFSAPFLLPGFSEAQPSGDYRVEQDQEAIEGLSRLAWRSVGAFIHLPALDAQGGARQMVPVSQTDLEDLIEKDQQKP